MTKLLGLSTIFALAATLLAGGCSGDSSSPGALSQPQAVLHVKPNNVNYGGPPEMLNWHVYTPPNTNITPTNYEVSINGDWSGQIGSPIANPADDAFCATAYCTPVVSVANGVTTVSWSGPQLLVNSEYPPYHFGLIGETTGNTIDGCDAMEQCVFAAHWSYPSIPPISWPVVAVAWPHPVRKHFKVWEYAEVYIGVGFTKKGPTAYGLWTFVPYSPDGSKQPKIVFKNPGPQKLYVLTSGIIPAQPVPTDSNCYKNAYCSEDITLLDSLSYADAPPPGYPSSHFIPLTDPPPNVLKPTK